MRRLSPSSLLRRQVLAFDARGAATLFAAAFDASQLTALAGGGAGRRSLNHGAVGAGGIVAYCR